MRTETLSALQQSGHISGLDCLRAIAVSFVLLAHFGLDRYVPGGFGVTLFFFISGFLITSLLLKEVRQSGDISIGRFYIRRMLRLYPALVIAVILSVIVYRSMGGVVTIAEVSASLFYYANYFHQLIGFGYAGKPEVAVFHPLSIQWSLAIEEQYYLLFPFLVRMLGKRESRLLSVLCGIAVFCLAWRIFLQLNGHGDRVYAATDTRIDSIIYGAILAVIAHLNSGVNFFKKINSVGVLSVSCMLLLVSFFFRDEFFRNTIRYTLQGVCLMPIVVRCCYFPGVRLSQLMASRIFSIMGSLSYSLYLFHGIAIFLTENIFGVSCIDVAHLSIGFYVVQVLLTALLSFLSYYGVEVHFMALRRRYGSNV